MDKLPDECPIVIETVKQAERLGRAMAKVMRFDEQWPVRVFSGDPKLHWNTGPDVLNDELKSMWEHGMPVDEKRRLLAAYTAEVLDQ